MSEGAAEIFSKRKDEGYCCRLIGRYLMDNEVKFREFFSEFQETFSSLLILHVILVYSS
jgi:hypothetical protein